MLQRRVRLFLVEYLKESSSHNLLGEVRSSEPKSSFIVLYLRGTICEGFWHVDTLSNLIGQTLRWRRSNRTEVYSGVTQRLVTLVDAASHSQIDAR